MCELYAINSVNPVRANEHLRLFYQDSVEHPHGWGLVWHEDARIVLHKEPLRAIDSAYLSQLLDEPICSSSVMAHIRNATMGSMTYENCHPFLRKDASGRTWVIAHNGTILEPRLIDPYKDMALGDTDSEQVAIYLVDMLDREIARKGAPLSFDERFDVLVRAIEALSPGNKLNLMMDDGEYVYVHTNTGSPTLYDRVTDDAVFVCTRPLTDGEGWRPVPSNRLVAYGGGCVVRTGPRHEHSMDDAYYFRAIMGMGPSGA